MFPFANLMLTFCIRVHRIPYVADQYFNTLLPDNGTVRPTAHADADTVLVRYGMMAAAAAAAHFVLLSNSIRTIAAL